MLCSLGATAVVGAVTVLVIGMGDTGWRLVGTGAATAIVAGLMIPFSVLADKPKSRREGLLGMTVIVIEFVGTLGLIWQVFRTLGSYRLEDRVGLTLLFFGITALPGILFLRFASMPLSRATGVAGIGLCGVVFVLLLIGGWNDRSLLDNEQWFASAGAVSSLGLLAVAALAGVGTEPRRWWRWVGVGMSMLAMGIALYAIWMRIHSENGVFNFIVSLAAVVAFSNMCLFVPLTASQKWLRVVTIVAGIICAEMIGTKTLMDNYGLTFSFSDNLTAAAAIITCCGSLALLVLAKINRNLDRVPVLSEIRDMIVICPGCKKKQTLPIGESACAGCGLKISIRVEEPRCPNCDYLLFMLTSDRCPECGTIVRGPAAAGTFPMIESA
jgi:hypothetical protein